MATVLFVKANNRPAEQAVSVKLYEAFLASYTETHPNDTIIELDLYKESLPYLDVNMINGVFKKDRGLDMTETEKQAEQVASQYLQQFLNADKIVIAFPLWNFTVPAVLHTYFDYLNRAGKTFKYTPEGPVGLVSNKKVALLNARGGIYSEGPAAQTEMAVNYVQAVMNFFGVHELSKVIIEGHNQLPEQAERIIQEGIEKAIEVAATF
ncbi:FMN-dependent NADH-azoreductase [Metabacillus iocasae]|uniref:FMN dependent NADH:quinone oxidoreductase n=1 Tax=Priestia iocasae TaxID=2291674 RepID=A0ABS2QWR4_9BACI|nr:FMN-dependent NADH-azoreductase [Metabacillus iocasae]MBM7703919.1 FMN-dependent NADH-azoreductase [Metabacillus iocasae]